VDDFDDILSVKCPKCGMRNQVVLGRGAAACAYCEATIPGEDVSRRGFAAPLPTESSVTPYGGQASGAAERAGCRR
jgi:hypothetical protein